MNVPPLIAQCKAKKLSDLEAVPFQISLLANAKQLLQ